MVKNRLRFHKEISRNKRNSILLIIIVGIVLIGLVYAIGMAIGADVFVIGIIAIIISLSYTLIGYYKSDKIALASVKAKPINKNNSKHKQYFDLVEGLCLASGMPMPKLYVMENRQINAFATGRNPDNSVICVTTGALEKLDKQELEGVLSHELSHIANYDIRFMTLTAILVGMIAIISQIFLRSLWFSSMRGRGRDKGSAIFLIIGILLAILAPIIVMLVQLAISRKREHVADSTAVKFTRSPTGLRKALEKIRGNSEMKVPDAVTPLFIEKPSKKKELFSTHPLLEERINRLKKM